MSNYTKPLDAIEVLYSWFGKLPSFGVRHMSEVEILDEVAELLGIQGPCHSKKTQVGKWLSNNDGTEYALSSGIRVRLSVLNPAEGSGGKAADYQICPVPSQS